MRRLVPLALVAGLALAGGAVAPPAADGGHRPTVRVGDDYFSPRSLTVRRGTTVRFRWVGRNRHNVSGGGRASRTTRRRGYVYSRRFSRTTRLVCTVHPDDMRMTVRVRR